ncbi:MAG: xanthine dehydrogenase family protein subunit M [Vicinamibacterales bacterium]
MFASTFDYYRARSVAEAQQLLTAHPGAKLLAGGHSLVPLMKLRLAAPTALVDIGRVPELRGITRRGDRIRIGALTTHAELAASDELRRFAQGLAEAAAAIGDPAVRNRGTIGGNIAHADPASDLPTVLVALDGRILAAGSNGERSTPAEEFFTGIMTTTLGAGEVLIAVEVPATGRGQGSAYEKFSHPASRYAVLGVAASVAVKDGVFTAARVAIGGLLPAARRASSVERALLGTPATPDSIARAAAQVKNDLGSDVTGDIFASAEYRAAMAPVYVRRAVATAASRAV